MGRLSPSLIIFSLLLPGVCRSANPSAEMSALPGSCHTMCGMEEVVVPDTVGSEADATRLSDNYGELELPTQRGCSCVESCFREGVCCEDYDQHCGPFHSQTVDDLALEVADEEHRLYQHASHHRRLLSVAESNDSMDMAGNDSDSGDSNTTQTEPAQATTASVPVPTGMAVSEGSVPSSSVPPSAPTTTASMTMPTMETAAKTELPSAMPCDTSATGHPTTSNTSNVNITASPTTSEPQQPPTTIPPPPLPPSPEPLNRMEREELLNASMSFFFVDSNVTFVNTSKWMDNFRNHVGMIWRDVLYHGDDYRAGLVQNVSTVEIVPRSPLLHAMPGRGEAIEMAFYVAFNGTPISNSQFPVVLNYVQSVRDTIQTQLKVRILDLMPTVSRQLSREVLGDDPVAPVTIPPTPARTLQRAARISTNMLGLEVPLGAGIVAAGLAIAILAIVRSRRARRKAPSYPYPELSTDRIALRHDRLSGPESRRGNEYVGRLPYQGYRVHGVDDKVDNPYPGPVPLAQRIQVQDAEPAGPIVVYDSSDPVMQNPIAQLLDEAGDGAPTAPPVSATQEPIRTHPPNTTPL